MVLRKSFYIHWSAGRSPRVHEVNPGRDPSPTVPNIDFCAQVRFFSSIFPPLQFLVCISSLFWERFGWWSGEQWRVRWSCILIFSMQ